MIVDRDIWIGSVRVAIFAIIPQRSSRGTVSLCAHADGRPGDIYALLRLGRYRGEPGAWRRPGAILEARVRRSQVATR